MGKSELNDQNFPTAAEELRSSQYPTNLYPESSYLLAYQDNDFLVRRELRPVRMQLELMKPDLILAEHKIATTVAIFGSARLIPQQKADQQVKEIEAACANSPEDSRLKKKLKKAKVLQKNAKYYDEAMEFSRIVTEYSQTNLDGELVVATGGGPGIMEAANRGAHEAGGKSIGLSIVLPFETAPNPYITPELCFQFHYFAIRKMHFLMRAKALVVFPGGYGTFDELFETLTLIQTKKAKPVPILLFNKKFWQRVVNFEALVEEGTIDEKDLDLFHYVETADQAWKNIQKFFDL